MTRATPPDDPEDGQDEAQDSDEARVRELRERIARGEYRADPETIARRILERGDLESAGEPEPPLLRLAEEPGEDPGEPDPADAVDEVAEVPGDEVEGESGA